MDIHRLKHCNVLVIGGSCGIGRGIADSLAEEKAQVIVMSRNPPSYKLPQSARLLWRPLDLTKIETSRSQISNMLSEFDKLDAVFYSAIFYGEKRQPFLEINENEWQQQLYVNLYGLWLCLSLTLPVLEKSSPSLFVHISSEVVYNFGPFRSGYAATKAGASNLIYSVAQENPNGKVNIMELLPEKMVDTPGIRKRRPTDFNYSNYMTPNNFHQATLELMLTRGKGRHGQSFVVGSQGLIPVKDTRLISNS